ncbi:hypothetical protein [Pararhizobium sp.]|uniref:hypothetical protein n=1 Tax=Pararhizobium sp. TaxID=1977563 RepID=UPI00272796BA|nr:hypothetical protein [Pararhizobium sp.]MDO9417923.1 hypothetical protein [Pararhizobium sp.]
MNTTAAKKFHAEMLALYDMCAGLGFRPVLFRRAVVLKGGVNAAKELVFKPGTTGLERLIELGRKDISMEAAMLRPEYRALFEPLELKEAEKCLAGSGRERSRGRLQAQGSP